MFLDATSSSCKLYLYEKKRFQIWNFSRTDKSLSFKVLKILFFSNWYLVILQCTCLHTKLFALTFFARHSRQGCMWCFISSYLAYLIERNSDVNDYTQDCIYYNVELPFYSKKNLCMFLTVNQHHPSRLLNVRQRSENMRLPEKNSG
jgi:hypothetical protein